MMKNRFALAHPYSLIPSAKSHSLILSGSTFRGCDPETTVCFSVARAVFDWNLDDANCYRLAGLPGNSLCSDVGDRWLYGQISSFLLAPFGGVRVDRRNPHSILIATQVLAMLQSLVVAVLTLTSTIQIWHILALSFFQGLSNALDAPAHQTFVKDIVEQRDDLASAIALNSSRV